MSNKFKYKIVDNKLIILSSPEVLDKSFIERINKRFDEIIIDCDVVGIGDYCFEDLIHVKKISLPKSLKKIGKFSFSGCLIEKIVIPDGVENIEYCAFFGCLNLKRVVLPKGLNIIENQVFSDCSSLKKIVIPEGVLDICESAFYNCEELKEVVFPEGLLSISSYAFEGCLGIKEIKIPDSVTSIGDGAFSKCYSLKTVNLPKSLVDHGSGIFSFCHALKKVDVPDNLQELPSDMCSNCYAIETLDIADGVVDTGVSTFYSCGNLRTINFNSNLKYINNNAFTSCTKLKEVIIPDSVEFVGFEAFSNCEGLEKIVLSKNIKEFWHDAFNYIGNADVYLGDNKYNIDDIRFMKNKNHNLFFKVCSENKYVFCRNGKIFEIREDELLKNVKRDIDEFYYVDLYFWAKKNKFIPDINVVINFPVEDIDMFYLNGNCKKWRELKYLSGYRKPLAIVELLKLSYALGVFQKSSKKRDEAVEYIKKYIFGSLDEDEIHEVFSGLDLSNGFDPMWAEFFMKYYKENKRFMCDEDGFDLLCSSYNNFSNIKKYYPNKVINTNRYVDLLTPRDVLNVINIFKYENVSDDDLIFANMVGKYGYNQSQFDKLLGWFKEGKGISKSQLKLFIDDDVENNDIVTYNLLEKDNPLGAVLGNITNCCQVVAGAGESCVKYGMTKPNSKFMTFSYKEKIIGQSWIWYDEKTGVVCLDNIEIPRKFIDIINHNENIQRSFIDCLKRLSENFVSEMRNNDLFVSKVTIGEGYNDIKDILKKNFKKDNNVEELNGYSGYSDAKKQYVIKKR